MLTISGLTGHEAGLVAPGTSLAEVARSMLEQRLSAVVVVYAGHIEGIVTEGDVLHAMRAHRDPALPVETIMTSPVHTVPGDMDFRTAYQEAARRGIRHIVVADAAGHPVGVVTESDFRRHLGLDFFRQLSDVDALMERVFPQLPPDARLEEALTAIEAVRGSAVLVVAQRKPVGIVTERDVVRLFLAGKDNPTLAEVMTSPVASIGPHASLADAAARMLELKVRHLAVVDEDGISLGLLSEHCMMRPLELDLVDEALAERGELLALHARESREFFRQARYQQAVLDNFPFPVWLKDADSRFLAVNRRFAQFFSQADAQAVQGKSDFELSPPDLAERYRADDLRVMQERRHLEVIEPLSENNALVWHETYKAPVSDETGAVIGTVGFARDITPQRRAEEALRLRNDALAGTLRGESLRVILERLVRSVEAEVPGYLCSILVGDGEGGQLRLGAAPSLDEEARSMLDGLPILDGKGISGTAASRRTRVVVENLLQDPLGDDFHAFAERAGINSGWSEPVFGAAGELLGTCTAYGRAPGRPDERQADVLHQAAQLAGVVIAHHRAEERRRLATTVFDHAHEGVLITDAQGLIVEVNPTFSELTGYSRAEVIGQSPRLLKSGHHDHAFYRAMWDAIALVGFWRGEVWNRRKDGEILVELLTISRVNGLGGETTHYVAIFSDITLLKQHQNRLEHLAHFDALTQLPNRMLLADRLQLAMAQAERSQELLAVCYLDLDGFKPVNDRFGHAAGDRLLVEVAQRLKSCVRAGDTVSRLGGDEFVLLLGGLADLHECDRAICRVTSTLANPFLLAGDEVNVTASVGVTLYPSDEVDADSLLRHADQAMYAAKQAGRNRYHLFDPESDRRARSRRELVQRIDKAIEQNEFVLHYQPKVDMRKGEVLGVEALIRWQHPERGLLLPAEFLPHADGHPVAVRIGEWVLQTGIAQLAAWQRAGLNLSMSINVSGEHLLAPNFSRNLGEVLAEHRGLTPSSVELEVLETVALEDMVKVADVFEQCRQLGVRFALDDFGTGYSSLTYFRRLPADVLKIDQSFVRDMLDDSEDMAIVEGVIGLTQAFQRKVVAEGVESPEHGMLLLQLGCDLAQGFGIARPMPGEHVPDWVAGFLPDPLWSSIASFQWSREDLPLLLAEMDFGRWKRALEEYLDGVGERNLPSLDFAESRFGRWCLKTGKEQYENIPGFAALVDIHREANSLAREMVVLRQQGRRAAELEALRQRFDQLGALLVDQLHTVQSEVLLSASHIGQHGASFSF